MLCPSWFGRSRTQGGDQRGLDPKKEQLRWVWKRTKVLGRPWRPGTPKLVQGNGGGLGLTPMPGPTMWLYKVLETFLALGD